MNSIDPDAPDLRRLWSKTGEIKYAALAIGRWPASPPPWAVIACYAEHARWSRQTDKGYNRINDGYVLDEIIRTYFQIEDEASQAPSYTISTYVPPSRSTVIALALMTAEGRLPTDDDYRTRAQAIDRRLDEEEEADGYPAKDETRATSDGAPRTRRYNEILLEWGMREVGAPRHLLSMASYVDRLEADEDCA